MTLFWSRARRTAAVAAILTAAPLLRADTNQPLQIVVEAARPVARPAPATFTADGWAEDLPGVTLERQGSLAPQSDLRIRGSAFNTAGYTLGGAVLRNPQTEHFNADLPLPATMLQPPRLLTGADAFADSAGHPSGSVAFDFAPVSPGVQVTGGGGPYGHRSAGAYARTAISENAADEALTLSSFFARDVSDRTDGQPDNDLDRWVAGAHAQQRLTDWQSDAIAAVSRRRFGARGFYGVSSTLPAEESLRDLFTLASVKGELSGDTSMRATLHARRVEDDYWLDRTQPELYANRHRSDTAALHGDLAHDFSPSLSLDSRLDLSGEKIASDYEGLLPGQGLGHHQRARASAALVPVYDLGPFSMRGGGAWETFSDASPAWLPLAAISFAPAPGQSLFASWSEAVRLPSYTELNYESPGSLGQAGLERQRTRTPESGWRGQTDNLALRATLFYEQADEAIDWVRDAPDARWTAVNLDEVETYGVALAAARALGETFVLTCDYQALDKDCGLKPYASRYVLDYARHEAHAGLQARLGRQWLLVLRQGLTHQAGNPAREGTCTRLDTSARLEFAVPSTGLKLVAGVDDLLDRDYQVFPGQPPAGRRWTLAAVASWPAEGVP
ncbi:MAG: TonB-dependent receptor [Kiritimatiellae bacterium]|nr:TonB-dependent receptor [Kiritimatiellia bacterium]